jgi:hypothetical protein
MINSKLMRKGFVFILVLLSLSATAQIRSMFDAPAIYLTSRDIENALNREGLGLDFGYAIGTHWMMVKLSVGAHATADFDAKKIDKTFFANPFGRIELGLGKWRSNGQQCAKNHQNAYSFLAKGGAVYNMGKRKADIENGIGEIKADYDYFLGAEVGLFYIKDMHKNSEYFINGGYMLRSKSIFAELGLRTFFNTRYSRS